MNHIKCSSYVGIDLSTAAVVAVHIGIVADKGKRFPVKVIDVYRRFVRKINEDKINFICNNCGVVDKDEVYSECDYCSNKEVIDKMYIGTNIEGVFCLKCEKPKDYSLTEDSLYEMLKENGLSLG